MQDGFGFLVTENIFTVDAKSNCRNDRWIAADPQDVPIIGKTKFPALVQVFMEVSSEGDVMEPHFLPKGQIINKEVYFELLKTVVVVP